jgi:Zn-dependent protease
MFLSEPHRTDYDLHFQCLGFPVRVHPFFWLAGLVLGAAPLWDEKGNIASDAPVQLLCWMAAFFVSILVHELGHSLTMRRFGQSSRIVLYMLGGLAIPESSYHYGISKRSRETPTTQILISLAGPGAGFCLALAIVLLVYLLGGKLLLIPQAFPFFTFVLPEGTSAALAILIWDLLFLNVLWGIFNLLPVYPLDGGQVASQLFQKADPWNGFVRCLWLSIFTSGAVAVAAWVYLGSRFAPLLFLSLGLSNYMMLQQISGRGPGGRPW